MTDIVSQLAGMSRQELMNLRSQIDALLQFAAVGEGSVTTPANDPDFLLDAITTVLRNKGAEFVTPQVLRRTAGYQAFSDKVPTIMRYLHKATRNRNQVRALLLISIEMLYQNMMEMNVTVGARTLMAHVHRIPSVVNRNFPGYAQSGMLGIIIGERKHVRQKRSDGALPQRLRRSAGQ